MKNICLITHIADPDGAFSIILGRLVFEHVDTFSCEIKEVDEVLKSVLECHKNYDTIYIVDLNVSDEMASTIDKSAILKEKVKVFDHHVSREYLNKYPFIHVVDSKDGRKECGTTLFYEHLRSMYANIYLEKEVLKKMIEWVRECDTFDFLEEYREEALQFRDLYTIYGRERYIEHFLKGIREQETFVFTETEKVLIEVEQERVKRYVEEKLEHIKFATINGIRVGISFAEANRSILGHTMADRFKDKIDIAIVINVDRSISYRAEKEEVDITPLATYYGGGGHKHAGGSPIPYGLEESIVEQIFERVKWENGEESLHECL